MPIPFMTFPLASKFYIYFPRFNTCIAFNQEKALVGAFSANLYNLRLQLYLVDCWRDWELL